MNTNIKIVGVVAVAAIVAATAIVIYVGRGDGEQPSEQQGASARKNRKPYLVQKNAAVSAVKYRQDESANKPARKRVGRATGTFSAAASDGIFRDSEGRPYPPSEQKIMSAAPILLIAYTSLTSPGFLDVCYHNTLGIAIMTGSLLIYAVAYLWGRRIMQIEM